MIFKIEMLTSIEDPYHHTSVSFPPEALSQIFLQESMSREQQVSLDAVFEDVNIVRHHGGVRLG
jgi:hypothetical protein